MTHFVSASSFSASQTHSKPKNARRDLTARVMNNDLSKDN